MFSFLLPLEHPFQKTLALGRHSALFSWAFPREEGAFIPGAPNGSPFTWEELGSAPAQWPLALTAGVVKNMYKQCPKVRTSKLVSQG